MKKVLLSILLIMIMIVLVCVVPYKKYEAYSFKFLTQNNNSFTLRGTVDASSAWKYVISNPYRLSFYFYEGSDIYENGKVQVDHFELAVASSGEVIISNDEPIIMGPVEPDPGIIKGSPTGMAYRSQEFNLVYEPCNLVVIYQVIPAGEEQSETKTFQGTFDLNYSKYYYNPMWLVILDFFMA